MRSILIDKLVDDNSYGHSTTKAKYSDGWFIAKPLDCSCIMCKLDRLLLAIDVLRGRGQVFHYKEDEKHEKGKKEVFKDSDKSSTTPLRKKKHWPFIVRRSNTSA